MKLEFDLSIISDLDEREALKTKLEREYNWVASGAKAEYDKKRKLEFQLQEWGRAFGKKLKEKYNIGHHNTSYSEWEYKKGNFSISIPYVLNRTEFKSENDFCVKIFYIDSSYNIINTAKTVEEVIQIIDNYGQNKS